MDVKTILAVGTLVACLGGFYYTTNLRLDRLETVCNETRNINTGTMDKVVLLEKQLNRLKRRIDKLK